MADQVKNTLCVHFLSGKCHYATCFKLHPANIEQAKKEYKVKGSHCTDLCYIGGDHDMAACKKLHIDRDVDPEFDSLNISDMIFLINKCYTRQLNHYLVEKGSKSAKPQYVQELLDDLHGTYTTVKELADRYSGCITEE